jgi:arylsulfatase A-like enzyme
MAERPNILILHTDQHRFDCLGAAGNKEVKTPAVDQLAMNGMYYSNSFCPYPICTPSRYSLVSGLYVHEHCGYTNHSTPKPGTPFFPALLKDAGYKTKAIGKMHYTPTYLDVGFEEMELAEQAGVGRWDDDYHRYLKELGIADLNDMEDQINEYRKKARDIYREKRGAITSNLREEHYPTTWIGDRAVKTVEEWSNTVGFIKPHHPSDPPLPWDAMYDPEKTSLLPGWTEECLDHDMTCNTGFFKHTEYTEDLVRRVTAYYYALISLVDHQVGKIVSVLKDKGIYDSTMIIFTSDHGDYRGYHHMVGKCGYLYEPLMRVPLIIKFPENKKAGARISIPVNTIDIAPTVLAAAGCAVPPDMKGNNLFTEDTGHEVIFGTG